MLAAGAHLREPTLRCLLTGEKRIYGIVHPLLLELHREGKLRARWPKGGAGRRGKGKASDDLGPAEAALLALLDEVDQG